MVKMAFLGQLHTLDIMYSSRSTSSARVIFPDKGIVFTLEQFSEKIKHTDTTNNKISTCVDSKDSALCLLVWEWELNFPGNFRSTWKTLLRRTGQIFDHYSATALQHHTSYFDDT